MPPFPLPKIHGNWATLLLPLNADDSIDFALLGVEIDHFIAAGVNGIYSNGSAGEFYTQTEAEFDRISELLASKCTAARMPFQIGACHMSAQLSRERIRRTRALNPTAFQIILPDWFVPTPSEINSFLEGMSAAADPVPLVLYNPPHAKRKLSPDEWWDLANAFPRIVGIKVPGGDDAWYAAMRPVMEKISVFIPGHLLARGLARGAHGAYSNVACLSPRGAQRWYELCRTEPAAGAELEVKILAFWNAHIATLITQHQFANMAADKAAAAAGGWLPGFSPRLRWPYRGVDEATVAAIASAARQELPELFRE